MFLGSKQIEIYGILKIHFETLEKAKKKCHILI
jgi:hypothetical protein